MLLGLEAGGLGSGLSVVPSLVEGEAEAGGSLMGVQRLQDHTALCSAPHALEWSTVGEQTLVVESQLCGP